MALDLKGYDLLRSLVTDARGRGAALIISSHQLDTIDELCDRAGILQEGRLREIDRRSPGRTVWFIDADGSDRYLRCITSAGGEEVSYEQGWHFRVAEAEKNIPDIIRALVAAGCAIREVRPGDPQGFGTAIRSFYTESAHGEVPCKAP